jgi:hypothetical protein
VHVEKGKAKQGKICAILLFFMPLCCFAGIEMQKIEKQEEGKVSGGAGLPRAVTCTTTFSKRKVCFFLFSFLTVRAIRLTHSRACVSRFHIRIRTENN